MQRINITIIHVKLVKFAVVQDLTKLLKKDLKKKEKTHIFKPTSLQEQ